MYSVGTRSIGVALVAALLATAGLAAAQQASFSVNLSPEGSPGTLSAGGTSSVSVSVTLEGEGFSCAEDEVLPVNVSVAQTRGVSGSADPNPVNFSNTMGIHSPPAGTYSETQSTSVTVGAASTASSGDREVQVTGTFPGGNYGAPQGSCSPSEFPPAEGSTTLTVTVEGTDTGTDGGTGGGGGPGGTPDGNGSTGDTNGSADGDQNGSPIGAWIAPAALVAAAFGWRRRVAG